jgi:TPR repeat protein
VSDNPAGFGNTGDLFISHSHADTDLVHPFVKALNDAGVSTWCSSIDNKISTRAITSVVQEKLRTSKLVIGLLSNNALEEYDRQTGLKKYHISAELNYAIRRDKLWSIIISKLDELPYHIENFPFYDFTEDIPPFSGEKWDGFLNAVKDEIDRRTQAPASSVRDPLAQAGGDAQEGGGDPAAPPEPPAFSAPFRASETIGSLLEVNDPAYGRDDAAPRIAPPSKQASLSEKALAKLANPAEITVTARDWCMFNLQALVEKGLAGQDPLAVHKTARAGNSDAQALVGLAHILGIAPFDQDYAAAGRWLERAGASGHARAKAELAVMIASRKFATYDLERIDQLAAEAAATDCARAKTYRALLRQTGTRLPSLTFEDSVRLLEEAHKQGDWLASTHFGWRLLRGNGIRRDVRRGISMLQDAAQAGEARACSYLGMAHGEGRGVPASAEKAAHWFRRAAQGGDLLGLFQWAWCHEAGYGTARDAGEARRLYRQASDRNDERATIRLAMMLLDGRGGVANPAEAAALLERSCMANNDDAKSLLAELHLEGRGVERDVAKAVELLEDAADSDQPWALWALGKLCEDGTGVPRDRERAVSLYRRAAFSATNLDLFRAILRRLDAMGERLRSPVG